MIYYDSPWYLLLHINPSFYIPSSLKNQITTKKQNDKPLAIVLMLKCYLAHLVGSVHQSWKMLFNRGQEEKWHFLKQFQNTFDVHSFSFWTSIFDWLVPPSRTVWSSLSSTKIRRERPINLLRRKNFSASKKKCITNILAS